MADIQVVKVMPNGTLTSDPWRGAPCIRLAYTFEEPCKGPDGRLSIDGLKTAWALLDTGADWNVIDETLVPPSARFVEHLFSEGVTGGQNVANHHVTFHIPEADMFHQTGVHTMQHRPSRPYGLILGRKFLQMTRFRYEGHLGIVSLQFFENLHAR